MEQYNPQPTDVSNIFLPEELDSLTEKLAENTHEVWAAGRVAEGWTYGEKRDDDTKKHPCIVPYNQLPESEREYDRRTAIETLKLIVSMGYTITKNETLSKKQFFLSYSTKDSAYIDEIRGRLEANGIDTWFAPVDIRSTGEWEPKVRQALAEADVFLLFLSENSKWSYEVGREIDWALGEYASSFEVNVEGVQSTIVPIIIDKEYGKKWLDDFPRLAKYQAIYLYQDDINYDTKFDDMLRKFGVKFPARLLQYGDAQFPICLYVGGDGITRYEDPKDIIVDVKDQYYKLPQELQPYQTELDDLILKKQKDCQKKGRNFHNGDQIRLVSATWGTAETREEEGSENKPLHMEMELTKYFDTHKTNFATNFMVDPINKLTVEDLLYTDIEGFDSKYSDPFTTNLSVVTSDGYIFLKTRSRRCAGNPGDDNYGMRAIQPAVSGSGSWKDCEHIKDPDTGVEKILYDPFKTAVREAREEIIGERIAADQFSVTFFGLARTWRTRFPFLFGELRLKDVTSTELLQIHTETGWEGEPLRLRFTIEDVTAWIRDNYYGRPASRYATTYFSLIASLIYEYPDKQREIFDGLRF